MFRSVSVQQFIKMLILVMAFTLILSFLAHDAIPHDHPHEIFGSGLQAAFHGNDRKWWYLMLLSFILIAANSINAQLCTIQINGTFSNASLFETDVSKIFSPLRQALRRGILNPKLCD